MLTEIDLLDAEKDNIWWTYRNLDQQDAIALAQILKTNTCLQVLNLNGNKIGDKGLEAIIDSIRGIKTIKQLNFGSNKLTDQSIIKLAEFLSTNTSVISLCLFQNKISNEGALALSNMLTKNKTLVCLYLYLNNIQNHGMLMLAKSITAHPSLKTVWLDHNPITETCLTCVVQLMKQNQTLTALEITFNDNGTSTFYTPTINFQKTIQEYVCKNLELENLKTNSVKNIYLLCRILAAIELPLPVELKIHMVSLFCKGYDDREIDLIYDVLLDRKSIGKFDLENMFNGDEFIRQCKLMKLIQ
ncbi:hypothetical protein HDV06_005378 [Boothiomyces sp. JEL0866]|nr:hypothetical protein HDV06_005378 [Boothiomyces sp. JEL0866]